jgi:hypothetical protein
MLSLCVTWDDAANLREAIVYLKFTLGPICPSTALRIVIENLDWELAADQFNSPLTGFLIVAVKRLTEKELMDLLMDGKRHVVKG